MNKYANLVPQNKIKDEYSKINSGFQKVQNDVEPLDPKINKVDNEAKQRDDYLQKQLDTIIIEGDSSVEAAQARVEEDGTVNPTLKARLDKKDQEFTSQLAQKAKKTDRMVNVSEFGAVGDGVTDDWEAIQSAINYAHDNKIGEVYIGRHKISKPLYLWGAKDFRHDTAVRLKGQKTNGSELIKDNNNTLNDGSAYGNLDAVIILANRDKDASRPTYNQGIENVNINGDFITGRTAFGIVVRNQVAHLTIENSNIFANIGFQAQEDMWQSSFRDLFINAKVKGFSMLKSGTSNLIERSWVYGAETIAWELQGVYSFGNNLAADECKGTVYRFAFGGWHISGLGCESKDATVAIQVFGSQVVIDNIKTTALTRSDSIVIHAQNNSRLDVNGGAIGSSVDVQTRQGKLLEKGDTNVTLNINNVLVHDKYATRTTTGGATTVGLKDYHSTPVNIRQGTNMPYLGLDRLNLGDFLDKYNDEPIIKAKAIFLDCENHPTRSNKNEDLGWKIRANKGDLFLENNPREVGAMGWVVINQPTGVNLRDCTFAKVPIIVSGATADRPTVNLQVGQQYFDTTLGKPIWCKVSSPASWVDANGTTV